MSPKQEKFFINISNNAKIINKIKEGTDTSKENISIITIEEEKEPLIKEKINLIREKTISNIIFLGKNIVEKHKKVKNIFKINSKSQEQGTRKNIQSIAATFTQKAKLLYVHLKSIWFSHMVFIDITKQIKITEPIIKKINTSSISRNNLALALALC